MTKILSLLFILCMCRANAQTADTLFLEAAIKNNIKLYSRSIHGQTTLYNGSQYKQPVEAEDQHPFFISEDWLHGKLLYNRQKYDSVPLLYDITSDQVITENYYNGTEMVLVPEKINQFEIAGNTFINLRHRSLPKNGFYQLIYNGTSQVVARRQKIIREKIASRTIYYSFDEKSRYFIYKNNSYFPVRTKGSVLKIFKDEKPALETFINKNKINFKSSPETALREIANHYDKLKKQP